MYIYKALRIQSYRIIYFVLHFVCIYQMKLYLINNSKHETVITKYPKSYINAYYL